jgi:hypothetical protein
MGNSMKKSNYEILEDKVKELKTRLERQKTLSPIVIGSTSDNSNLMYTFGIAFLKKDETFLESAITEYRENGKSGILLDLPCASQIISDVQSMMKSVDKTISLDEKNLLPGGESLSDKWLYLMYKSFMNVYVVRVEK